jgi:radical SAM protein with 4Fe4S-binding SPASM domain
MRLILTDDPTDLGERSVFSDQCDCDCACPVDGMPTPVLSLPVAYYLEITPACNNRCPGCGNVYADRVPLAPPLDGEEWCDLIAILASHARQFKVTGGEATLHPAFAEIVRAIAGHGIPFTLFTNGRWSRPGALIQLLRGLPLFEGFLVSLHGPDADTHEAFSGVPGSFAETVSNVRRAVDAGLDVAISAVIHQGNWDRIPETLDVTIGLGAHHLVCNRSIGAPVAGVTPDRAQLRAAIAAIESHRLAGHPIRFGNCIPQCFAPSSSRGCTAGSTFATVDPWGRMRPCNHAPLVAGDLRTQPVPEVWQGERMAVWRSLVPVSCASCAAFVACHGGCRAQALLTGQAQDPLIRGSSSEVLPFLDEERFLYGELRPVGQFIHRFEGDVGVLVHKGQAAPVPPGCAALWPKLDGSLTLRQIEGQYGDLALDWVGALYEQEMVTWALG